MEFHMKKQMDASLGALLFKNAWPFYIPLATVTPIDKSAAMSAFDIQPSTNPKKLQPQALMEMEICA